MIYSEEQKYKALKAWQEAQRKNKVGSKNAGVEPEYSKAYDKYALTHGLQRLKGKYRFK